MKKDIVVEALGLDEEKKDIVETEYLQGEIMKKSDLSEYAQNNIKEAIDVSMSAMHELRDLAQATEHPRAYEVFANLVKSIVDSNKDLVAMEDKRKEQENKQPNDPTGQNAKTINNIVFQGSTEDMLKALRENKGEDE